MINLSFKDYFEILCEFNNCKSTQDKLEFLFLSSDEIKPLILLFQKIIPKNFFSFKDTTLLFNPFFKNFPKTDKNISNKTSKFETILNYINDPSKDNYKILLKEIKSFSKKEIFLTSLLLNKIFIPGLPSQLFYPNKSQMFPINTVADASYLKKLSYPIKYNAYYTEIEGIHFVLEYSYRKNKYTCFIENYDSLFSKYLFKPILKKLKEICSDMKVGLCLKGYIPSSNYNKFVKNVNKIYTCKEKRLLPFSVFIEKIYTSSKKDFNLNSVKMGLSSIKNINVYFNQKTKDILNKDNLVESLGKGSIRVSDNTIILNSIDVYFGYISDVKFEDRKIVVNIPCNKTKEIKTIDVVPTQSQLHILMSKKNYFLGKSCEVHRGYYSFLFRRIRFDKNILMFQPIEIKKITHQK